MSNTIQTQPEAGTTLNTYLEYSLTSLWQVVSVIGGCALIGSCRCKPRGQDLWGCVRGQHACGALRQPPVVCKQSVGSEPAECDTQVLILCKHRSDETCSECRRQELGSLSLPVSSHLVPSPHGKTDDRKSFVPVHREPGVAPRPEPYEFLTELPVHSELNHTVRPSSTRGGEPMHCEPPSSPTQSHHERSASKSQHSERWSHTGRWGTSMSACKDIHLSEHALTSCCTFLFAA
jgi:hypothetical protein